jgi:hypothetical protein
VNDEKRDSEEKRNCNLFEKKNSEKRSYFSISIERGN